MVREDEAGDSGAIIAVEIGTALGAVSMTVEAANSFGNSRNTLRTVLSTAASRPYAARWFHVKRR